MNEGSMWKPALIGGVLLGILSSLPILGHPCLCCAWIIAGGVLAARLHVKESPVTVTLGRGVGLGLLTGAIGTVVWALFSLPLNLILNRGGMNYAERLKQTLEQFPNLPAETRQMMEALTAQGNMEAIFFISDFFTRLVFYSLVAMIGGAIGVAVFEKRKPGSGPDNIPHYPPPSSLPPPPPPDGM